MRGPSPGPKRILNSAPKPSWRPHSPIANSGKKHPGASDALAAENKSRGSIPPTPTLTRKQYTYCVVAKVDGCISLPTIPGCQFLSGAHERFAYPKHARLLYSFPPSLRQVQIEAPYPTRSASREARIRDKGTTGGPAEQSIPSAEQTHFPGSLMWWTHGNQAS